jgi:hypothetical protein
MTLSLENPPHQAFVRTDWANMFNKVDTMKNYTITNQVWDQPSKGTKVTAEKLEFKQDAAGNISIDITVKGLILEMQPTFEEMCDSFLPVIGRKIMSLAKSAKLDLTEKASAEKNRAAAGIQLKVVPQAPEAKVANAKK